MSPRLVHYSDVENACDTPHRIGRLARAIRTLDGSDAAVVGTGDNTSPGVLPLRTDGAHVLEFYDAIGPDVETFGNHDFDYGPEATLEVVRRSPQTWLSANVRRNGGRFGTAEGVEPWTVLERDGTRIGFTAVTTPRTASLNPMADGLSFTDPVDAAREALDDVRAEEPDVLVVCSHLGTGDDRLARALDVDVVLGGHVPSPRIEEIEGTLVVRPGDGGEAVVEVDVGDEPSAALHRTAGYDPAPDVVDAFEALEREIGLDKVVATVSEPLLRTEETLFGGESAVGNFVADAYRWKTGADAALQNSGGIRSGPALSGEVTAADVIGLVPFPEPVVVAELSGETLEDVVSDATGVDLGFAEPGWWHAHVSGMVLERDGTDVSVRRVDGEPLDPDGTYTLATSGYLFHTDDEFSALEPEFEIDRTAKRQYDVLLEYAREYGISAETDGRIEGRSESDGRNEDWKETDGRNEVR